MEKMCNPCGFEETLRAAKDGETIAIAPKCVDCDYRICNINFKE